METAEANGLRWEVREFLAAQIRSGSFVPKVDAWLTVWDEEFSRALADCGWVGMTIPAEYGGHGRSFLERFVVTEELLAAGAPVAAHWIADRQMAPALIRFGTPEQRRTFLPAIARGESYWAIGMSEPDSGSDLASVRTRADRVDGGWRVTGTKVWTSGAHRANAMMVLVRTEPADARHRHAGLSQMIVELPCPDVHIRAIRQADGEHHFNEVHFDGAFVPDERVVGSLGDGWAQVTAELAYERSGPERLLSMYPLLAGLLAPAVSANRVGEVGRLLARLAGLRHMSASVAADLERGEPVDSAAAAVKVLGTTLEGDIADLADAVTGDEADESVFAMTRRALAHRPGLTLRGGTNEVLRGVIVKEMGLR